MIGYGWTISYEDLQDKDIYGIIACFVIMVHMMIGGLTFIDHGDANKYHDFGGPQGAVLVALRLILWAGFVYGIVTTIQTAPRKSVEFLKRFALIGSLYIMAFPILWIISTFNWMYVRNRIITFGNFAI